MWQRILRALHSNVITTLSILGALILFFVWIKDIQAPRELPDSAGYQQFSQIILDDSIWQTKPAPEVPIFRAIRSPGYPMLLALAEVTIGGNQGRILILHTLLAFFVICSFPLLLRSMLPPLFSIIALMIGFRGMLTYFPQVLTEWAAYCAILVVIGFSIQHYSKRSAASMLSLSLSIAVAMLIRPALLIALVVLAFAFVLMPRSKRIKASGAALAGLSPVIFWTILNACLIGAWGITSFDGFNLFGVAALVGSAQEKADDPEDLKLLIRLVNEKKKPTIGTETESLRQVIAVPSAYNYNIYGVALKESELLALGPVRLNQLMKAYALRAIESSPNNYAIYVLTSIGYGLTKKLPVILSFLLILICVYKRIALPMAFGCRMALLLHLSNILLCSMVQSIQYRYLHLTYYALIVILICCATTVLMSVKKIR